MWDGMYSKVDRENNRYIYYTTQFGSHHRVDQATGERVPITPVAGKDQPFYRFTWTTPLALSPHNNAIVYTSEFFIFLYLKVLSLCLWLCRPTPLPACRLGLGYISRCASVRDG
jgi:hypothetical protein